MCLSPRLSSRRSAFSTFRQFSMVLQNTSVRCARTVSISWASAARLCANPVSSVFFSPSGPLQSMITCSRLGETLCRPGPITCFTSGNSPATWSATSPGSVAVTKTNWVARGAPAPTAPRSKDSSRKSTSTSSSTAARSASRVSTSLSRRLATRPGVAISRSTGFSFSSRTCCLKSAEPVTHMLRSGQVADSPLATRCTWAASSAVGASTSIRGAPGRARHPGSATSSARKRSTSGSK
mmetsp:Transcript_21090/g.33318  ORF Transcript_21090/g.33318 Transcript_21090/m.33318 type:complete len:238 (+) Transcript_21090:570-1283(+)